MQECSDQMGEPALNLVSCEDVDWFNPKSYDRECLPLMSTSVCLSPGLHSTSRAIPVHRVWDAQSKSVGPYIAPHTSITEIDLSLDLLWPAGVDSGKDVLGGQGWVSVTTFVSSQSRSWHNLR